MSGAAFAVRPGAAGDAPGITAILNHYVLHTNARFDTEPFSVESRAAWMRPLLGADGPYRLFVAEEAEALVGFACAQPYRQGPAFARTVEVSVYLAADRRRAGLGSALYRRLLDALAEAPVHRALAGIALPNDASIALHRKFGFEDIGVFDGYAVKHGQHISSLWMQKRFG